MNAYYLQTEQMTVGYHGKPLIEKINLCLRRGEIMTLIGPNGSGKSTILKSIVRQLRPLGGVVRLEQVSLEELSPQAVAQKMSVLMTDRLQPELMTCREVAAAGRYPYTGKLGLLTQRDWEKVDEALALVHGSALADQAFTAISDGQRQRVLLARALCQEPEILVLDEPTSFFGYPIQAGDFEYFEGTGSSASAGGGLIPSRTGSGPACFRPCGVCPQQCH